MHRFPSISLLAVSILWWASVAYAQEPALSFKAKVRPFLDAHCTDCHGSTLQKAGLRLDELKPDFRDAKTMAHWVHVYDKVVAGEMPPKKRPRPPQGELDAVTQWLHKELHAASLERQQKEGRTVVRRLNRTEYENTIHDLLGIGIDLKEMLPEDNTAAGFDNVSTVLDFTATHWLTYQEAAEKAVRSVLPRRPHAKINESRTGRQIVEKMESVAYVPLLG